MSKFIGFVAIVAIIVIAAYLIFSQNQPTQNTDTQTSSPDTTLTPGAVDPNNELLQGGSSFTDPAGVYTFLYPNDWKIETMNNGQYTRVYMQGPTQTGQTEMYDGVIVHFETADLGGKTLSSWVDERIKTSTSDGTSELTQPKTATSVNGYTGFKYTIRGLGESEHLVIQKDTTSNNAIVITTLVADPGNLGFQGQVDSVLATLQILK